MIRLILLFGTCLLFIADIHAQPHWEFHLTTGNRPVRLNPSRIDSELKINHPLRPKNLRAGFKYMKNKGNWSTGHSVELGLGRQVESYEIKLSIAGEDPQYHVRRTLYSYGISYGYQFEYFPNNHPEESLVGTSIGFLPQIEFWIVNRPELNLEYKGIQINESNGSVLLLPASGYLNVQHRFQLKKEAPVYMVQCGVAGYAAVLEDLIYSGLNFRIGLGVTFP